jgi:hypothetical protein
MAPKTLRQRAERFCSLFLKGHCFDAKSRPSTPKMTPRERATRSGLQIPFETSGSTRIGKFDRNQQLPWSELARMDRQARVMPIEACHGVGGESV